MLDSFFVIILGLCFCCCCTESSQIFLGRPRLYGPKEALVKSIVEFRCEVPNHPMGLEVLLQIFKLGDHSKVLGFKTSMEGVVGDIPMYIKMQHEGYLECMASIQNRSISDINATFSYSHYLKVIEPVKGAQIIHSGLVELFEESTLKLNCTLSAGNYVSYKWLRSGQLISPSSSHNVSGNQLTISRVTSKDSGSYRCVATNVFNHTVFTANSSEVEITVKVPVGGPVTMDHDYDRGENYAVIGLRLYCKADKGTHPRFQWFLNKTLLQDQGRFYYVVDQPPKQSILLLSVGRSSAGTYHCEVSDSFDNTTAISSKRRYLDKEVLNRIPDFVVGIVFGSFAFLIFLVSACCCIGVIFRRRQYGEKSLWSLQTQRTKAAHEDELGLSGYSDDPDLLEMVREDEYDETSEASEDEWPWIQKETLKDEPV